VGNPIDRVVSDFTAGAVEDMLVEVGDDHDLLVVEGQGSIIHPAYSAVTCGILHGSMADGLVLCHAAGREQAVHGYESFSLPPLADYVDLYEGSRRPSTGEYRRRRAQHQRRRRRRGRRGGSHRLRRRGRRPSRRPGQDGAGRIVDRIVEAGLGEGTAAADGGVADE